MSAIIIPKFSRPTLMVKPLSPVLMLKNSFLSCGSNLIFGNQL